MDNEKDFAFLLLRMYVGIIFLYHGIRKISIDNTGWTDFMSSKGFSKTLSTLIAIIEIIIAILLLLGITTRYIAVIGLLFMICAVAIGHSNHSLISMGYQLSIIFVLASILICGSGKYGFN